MITVIPLRSQSEYEELRFALRSLCAQYPGTELMIVGPKIPDWMFHVEHIEYPDTIHYEWKSKNIFDKTCEAFNFTDRMLFMNDDHILLSPVDYSHHKGKLLDNILSRNPIGTYTRTLQNTYDVFGDVMDFDTHCPIWYDKEAFLRLKELDWSKEHGYGIKTSYCALNGIAGQFYEDLQFYDKIGDYSGRLYFSTNDNCQLQGLHKIFKEKCKFEK